MAMVRYAVVALMALFMVGCDDYAEKEAKRTEQKKAEQAREEKEWAVRQAEREAERKAIMENPALVDERLSAWLKVKDGLFIFRDEHTDALRKIRTKAPWFALPSSTPWFVSCSSLEMRVAIGPWTDGGSNDERAEPTFSLRLTGSGLKEDECTVLVERVGRRMLELQAAK